ncbi:MAG: L-galactonate transporter [Pseudomonadota bacterium]
MGACKKLLKACHDSASEPFPHVGAAANGGGLFGLCLCLLFVHLDARHHGDFVACADARAVFVSTSATQLPLGKWLDRYGPKTVIMSFLVIAVLGCAAFAMANSFLGLWLARFLCGVGVSACLMAPLTGYRRWMDDGAQLRANSWMLMTGSLGMLASTLPVQWLMPFTGWRAIFAALAGLVVLAIFLIYKVVPIWEKPQANLNPAEQEEKGYGPVWRNAYFWRMAPVGFFCYAGMLAVQTLWAGPWMTVVGGYTPLSAATGLFAINLCMLITFWVWGLITPRLSKGGISANQLIAWGQPLSFAVLFGVIWLGPDLGAGTAAALALFCMASTFVALAQPAVGMAFPPHLAGRALSAYNLVIFVGVFVVQWGIGLGIDFFKSLGWSPVLAFQSAFSVFGLCAVLSYVYFHWANRDNSA